MISKKRIRKILGFQKADRVGIYDCYDSEALSAWQKHGLPKDDRPEDYFGLDLIKYGFDQRTKDNDAESKLKKPCVGYSLLNAKVDEDKFAGFSFMEPFGHACYEFGLQEVLGRLACGSDDLQKFFHKSVKDTIKVFEYLTSRGYKFDCAWPHGDLGYRDGLFFSKSAYKRLIYPHQKEIFKFMARQDLPVILHCDGNINQIIPDLIDIGVRAIEPLEVSSNMDIFFLKKEYKKDLVLFGNIGLGALRSSLDDFKKELISKFSAVKDDGFYIYRMDGPVGKDISFSDYKKALELVARYGQCAENDKQKEDKYEYTGNTR